MKPILKWAGSKLQVLKNLRTIITQDLIGSGTFYEPFIGGGALAFDLEHPRTVINDLNPELVNLYRVVKTYPEELIRELRHHQAMHCCLDTAEDWYYEIRAWDREPDFWDRPAVEIAARTIYLNKTCFNGLFRVNSKGYFNTPIGRTTSGKCPDIVQEDAIRELSKFLQTVDIREGDYEQAIQDLLPGDWIFFDPPYEPGEEIKTSGFVGYQKDGWTRQDLLRLRAVAEQAVRRGAKVIISNNDTAAVREIFSEWDLKPIEVARSINRNGAGRRGKELLILSTNIKS